MADQVEAKAKITVTADTKQAVQATSNLQKSIAGIGTEAKKVQSSVGDTIGSIATGFAKFGLAAGGVSTAFDLIGKGLDTAFSEERKRNMEAMLAPGTVDRLRAAIDNLVPRTSVLNVAVKAMTGDFALTEKQMGTVLKAAIALEQKGFGPAAEIAEKLHEGLAEGVNKLDNYGINLEKTSDRLADVNKGLEAMQKLADSTPIDKQASALRTLRDDLASVGEAIKGMVASAVSGIADIYDAVRNPGNGGDGLSDWMMDLVYGDQAPGNMYSRKRRGLYRPTGAQHISATAEEMAEIERGYQYDLQAQRNKAEADAQLDAYNRKYGLGEYKRGPRPKSNYRPSSTIGMFAEDEQGLGSWSQLGASDYGNSARDPFNSRDAQADAVNGISAFTDEVGKLAQAGDPALKFMDELMNRATMTGAAFGVFQDAFGSAVAAAIDGSKGISEAFQDAAAAGLKSLAVEYAVRALGEGAQAVASLAWGDVRGAATHGIAAGKFALAATAAGVSAAALGGGGGGRSAGASASGGGASGNYSAGPAPAGGGGNNITINLGDGFIGSPAQVEVAITRAVRSATQKGERGADSYAAKFSGG